MFLTGTSLYDATIRYMILIHYFSQKKAVVVNI